MNPLCLIPLVGYVLLAPSNLVAAEDAPTVKLVKLTDFQKAIDAHKGKVVVIDMWQIT